MAEGHNDSFIDEEKLHLQKDYKDQEARIMQIKELRTLYYLHHNIWDETLLENPFFFYYQHVLSPRERQIVDRKILGKSLEEIALDLGITRQCVMRYIYNIKYVFRCKSRGRVNKFWQICKTGLKKKKKRKEK